MYGYFVTSLIAYYSCADINTEYQFINTYLFNFLPPYYSTTDPAVTNTRPGTGKPGRKFPMQIYQRCQPVTRTLTLLKGKSQDKKFIILYYMIQGCIPTDSVI